MTSSFGLLSNNLGMESSVDQPHLPAQSPVHLPARWPEQLLPQLSDPQDDENVTMLSGGRLRKQQKSSPRSGPTMGLRIRSNSASEYHPDQIKSNHSDDDMSSSQLAYQGLSSDKFIRDSGLPELKKHFPGFPRSDGSLPRDSGLPELNPRYGLHRSAENPKNTGPPLQGKHYSNDSGLSQIVPAHVSRKRALSLSNSEAEIHSDTVTSSMTKDNRQTNPKRTKQEFDAVRLEISNLQLELQNRRRQREEEKLKSGQRAVSIGVLTCFASETDNSKHQLENEWKKLQAAKTKLERQIDEETLAIVALRVSLCGYSSYSKIWRAGY